MNLPATDGDVIVRNLINDLLNVWPNALKVWPKQSGKDISYGRITQNAIFAMLADMYLWIDDYSNAEKYAQMVIDSKKEYFTNNYSSYYQVNGYPLVPDNDNTILLAGAAYDFNFGEGGGPESIFELDFSESTTDGSKSNDVPAEFFYRAFKSNDKDPGYGLFAPAEALWKELASPQIFLSNKYTRIKESIHVDN